MERRDVREDFAGVEALALAIALDARRIDRLGGGVAGELHEIGEGEESAGGGHDWIPGRGRSSGLMAAYRNEIGPNGGSGRECREGTSTGRKGEKAGNGSGGRRSHRGDGDTTTWPLSRYDTRRLK